MPSGKEHYFILLKQRPVLVLYGVLLWIFTGNNEWFIGYLLGLTFVADFVDPDLDQIGITTAEGRALKIPVFGHLFVTYSTLYGALFRRKHRKMITHSFAGTVVRTLYFFWPLIIYQKFLLLFGIISALTITDYLHIIADKYGKKFFLFRRR